MRFWIILCNRNISAIPWKILAYACLFIDSSVMVHSVSKWWYSESVKIESKFYWNFRTFEDYFEVFFFAQHGPPPSTSFQIYLGYPLHSPHELKKNFNIIYRKKTYDFFMIQWKWYKKVQNWSNLRTETVIWRFLAYSFLCQQFLHLFLALNFSYWAREYAV